MNVDLYTELKQVAAVAMSWMMREKYGRTLPPGRLMIVDDVLMEMKRQLELWGDQAGKPTDVWLAILAEEVGEAARATDLKSETLVEYLEEAELRARHILEGS
jgi:hypothetical protein